MTGGLPVHAGAVLGLAVLGLFTGSAAALGQTPEAGITVSSACADDCAEKNTALLGGYASIRIDDRYEIGGRYATMALPGFVTTFESPPPGFSGPLVLRREDVRRHFYLGYIAWHFAPAHSVRPFAGISLGRFSDTSLFSCSPPGCEDLPANALGNARLGKQSEWHGDIGLMAGLSGRAGRFDFRGGVQLHNFGLELSAFEFLGTIGYVFVDE